MNVYLPVSLRDILLISNSIYIYIWICFLIVLLYYLKIFILMK